MLAYYAYWENLGSGMVLNQCPFQLREAAACPVCKEPIKLFFSLAIALEPNEARRTGRAELIESLRLTAYVASLKFEARGTPSKAVQ